MHVFPFSPREGTAAWAWRGQQPPPAVVRERIARLEKLERQLRLTYHRRFVGQTVETLVEQATDAGAAKGLSRRYAPVLLRCRQPRRLLGRVVTGRAIEADAERIVVEAND
jgi:threonylcarbamoyladenosine tRNA methylthiotransferase MtaB